MGDSCTEDKTKSLTVNSDNHPKFVQTKPQNASWASTSLKRAGCCGRPQAPPDCGGQGRRACVASLPPLTARSSLCQFGRRSAVDLAVLRTRASHQARQPTYGLQTGAQRAETNRSQAPRQGLTLSTGWLLGDDHGHLCDTEPEGWPTPWVSLPGRFPTPVPHLG